MTGLTMNIAAFVSGLSTQDIPARCLDAARIGMRDCVAVMIAGRNEPAPRLVADTVHETRANDGVPEIPLGRWLSPADAALVNGVAGHVLDYDDVGLDGHPSVAMTPAILAEGWALDVGGAEALAAYVAGYEVWALLENLEPGAMHERGFHPTAVSGTLASAAACAYLNRLDEETTGHALAIAASLASGLVANFGTMTKSLHAGRAAQAGVMAARLAKAGFTGSSDALEHRTGFLRAHSASGSPDLARGYLGLGQEWRLQEQGVHIKRYPICYATHRSIDAMIDLAEGHDLRPDEVEEIHVKTGRTQRLMLRNIAPKTGLEAKFSMEFAMASALVERKVGLSELTDDFVGRSDVVAAMRKVTCTTTDETMPGLPFAPSDTVSVRLRDGRRVAHAPVVHARGSWQSPMSEDELEEKFLDCCHAHLSDDHAARLFRSLGDMPNLVSVREVPLTVNP